MFLVIKLQLQLKSVLIIMENVPMTVSIQKVVITVNVLVDISFNLTDMTANNEFK